MKLIDNWFFEDDFKFEEQKIFNVNLFCDGKHIYQDKRGMLYSNMIGQKCTECGEFVSKHNWKTICNHCDDIKQKEKYESLPIVDSTEYLYSALLDEYFSEDDWDCVYSHLLEMTYDELMGFKFEELRIHPCNECFPQMINLEDYFDDAHEDFDLDSYTPIEKLQKLEKEINLIFSQNKVGYIADATKRISISNKEWLDMKMEILKDQNENNLS